jgi:pimeloyl-ACP methyl ester carboxylesterase
MQASQPSTRIVTPARIVALALIAVLAVGLAYLRFGSDAAAVSVPAGAHAGDLILHPCTYQTEKGAYDADCGTLVVPENRADPHSRLIALPVTRIRAHTAHPSEPVFRLEGGPGITNMQFANASRFADQHDVVLVGYRGVDGSVKLNCTEVESALKHSAGYLGARSMRAYANALSACAKRLQADGVDLAGYTLAQRVDDLEAARKALGYPRIDLISESAGTRTAMIYSWRYPKSIHRSVMIAVNPPGHFLWNAKASDAQIHRYSALCAKDGGCSERTDDLAASMTRTAAHIPDHWWFLPIKKGNVKIASFYGLMDSSSDAAPISAPMTFDSWLAAANGDASGFWLMSLAADLTFPKSFVWGDLAAVARADAGAAQRHFSDPHRGDSILGDPGTEFIWGGGLLTRAWPSNASDNQYSRVQTSKVPTLLIGGTVDGATPSQAATDELLPHLPNGHQVVLSELGHTTDFWSYEPNASSHLVNTFFDSGKVDRSLYTHRTITFTPDVTQTAIAKGIAGTMLSLAIITVLSLVWLPRRVHRNGGFGRKAGAVLRSLYALVLGLGGWFAGALIALTTLPTVPLDDELLVVLSIGAPVGLGIYWAWVRRDSAVRVRTAGLVVAATGALVGAWLGFHATAGLLALVTAIVGAAAGANLTVIGFDIARERSARDRSAAATVALAPSGVGV